MYSCADFLFASGEAAALDRFAHFDLDHSGSDKAAEPDIEAPDIGEFGIDTADAAFAVAAFAAAAHSICNSETLVLILDLYNNYQS